MKGPCAVLTALCLLAMPLPLPAAEHLLEIRNHLFYPDTLKVPAGVKLRLLVVNHDATPEEFESYSLNREKVIMGGQRTVIFIGPLAPGSYDFFGEFNPRTAVGRVIAE